jgi:hypothetical protein
VTTCGEGAACSDWAFLFPCFLPSVVSDLVGLCSYSFDSLHAAYSHLRAGFLLPLARPASPPAPSPPPLPLSSRPLICLLARGGGGGCKRCDLLQRPRFRRRSNESYVCAGLARFCVWLSVVFVSLSFPDSLSVSYVSGSVCLLPVSLLFAERSQIGS